MMAIFKKMWNVNPIKKYVKVQLDSGLHFATY